MKKTICPICESEITEEEDERFGMPIERGEHIGEPAHDTCYSDDLAEPIATILFFKDGEKYQAQVGGYFISIEDFPFSDDGWNSKSVVEEYAKSIKWVSTDAWRGYYEGQTPKGWEKMIDSWFCGFDGHNLSEEDYTAQLEKKIDDNQNPPVDLMIGFPRTSNVFSTGIEVYVRPEDKNKLISWLKGEK